MADLLNKFCACAVGLFAALSVSAAHADARIYKYRTPDGGILYSQNHAARGRLTAVLDVPYTSPAVSRRITQRQLARDKAQADRLEAQRRAHDLAAARNDQATQAVAAARLAQLGQLALQAGAEPLPGERLATAGGRSRLTDAYWQRQRALQQLAAANGQR